MARTKGKHSFSVKLGEKMQPQCYLFTTISLDWRDNSVVRAHTAFPEDLGMFPTATLDDSQLPGTPAQGM